MSGEKSNPLQTDSFKVVCKASALSFSSNVTRVTPALIAPREETKISAELVESAQSSSLSPFENPLSRSPKANAELYLSNSLRVQLIF